MSQQHIEVAAIAAMAENRVIGRENRLPWNIPDDLARFHRLTEGGTVLMGRKTFESFPSAKKPLPNRENVVATQSQVGLDTSFGVTVCDSAEKFVEECRNGRRNISRNMLWIIGGEQVYSATVDAWDKVYLTVVHDMPEGDTFFPEFEQHFTEIEREEHETHTYITYVRKKKS